MDFKHIPFIQQKKGLDIRRIYFHLPQSETLGNLGNMYETIVLRNEYFNKLIAEIYTTHNLWRKSIVDETHSFSYSMPNELEELNYKIETLAYWLRKSSDEILSLQYLLKYWSTTKTLPSQIKIDSIGALLSESNKEGIGKEIFDSLEKHLEYFNSINNVSNTFKHSFINYEVLHLVGKDEPTLNALGYNRNKIVATGPNYFSYYLRNVIVGYNKFYLDSLENIERFRDELYLQFEKLNSEQNPEVCDATKMTKELNDDNIKI